jgi:hypothetical protein
MTKTIRKSNNNGIYLTQNDLIKCAFEMQWSKHNILIVLGVNHQNGVFN